jgi:TatA/E family protein of Tat protein translocase
MGGVSFWHILVVVVVVIAVFGHRHIPAAFGAVGSVIGQFRKNQRAAKREQDNVIEGTYVRRDD